MTCLRTTRAKLLAVLVPVIVITTLVSMTGLTLSLEDFLRERLQRDTGALAEAVKASLQQQMLTRVDLTQQTIEDVAATGDIRRIVIVDRRGRVVHAHPGAERGRVLDRATEPACAGCHAGGGAPPRRTELATDADGHRVLRVAVPIENQPRCQRCHGTAARLNGMLLVERSADAEAGLVAAVRTRLGATGGVTILAVALLVVAVTTVVVHHPVQSLIGAARRIGAGDLTTRVAVRGEGEIAELGATLNTMTASLAASVEEIRAKNLELGVLYRLVDRISKSVFIGELKPLALDIAAEVLGGSHAALVCPTLEPGRLEVYERDATGIGSRRVIPLADLDRAPLPVPAAVIRRWLDDELTDVRIDGDAGCSLIPLRFAERDLALLVVDAPPGGFTGEHARLAGAVRDHVSVAFENARLYTLAITDDLTQLYSVRHFQLGLEEAVRRSERYGEPIGLIALDLDHFKSINDTYGHPAGDAVLREVADRMRATVREVDLPCRNGGEEFAVILPHSDARAARIAAERLRVALAARPVVLPDGRAIAVTASLGVAGCPGDARSAAALLELADQALYRAKRLGRNRVCAASDVASEGAISRAGG